MKKLFSILLAALLLMNCAALAEIEIKQFPEKPENYAAVVDPANPLKTIFSGAYSVEIPMGEGAQPGKAVVYLAEGFAQTQGFIMIVPATGTTPAQALEEGGWKAIADQYNLYLFVVDTSEAPATAELLNAATSFADTRNYWRQPEGRNYFAAYGDNADTGLAFVESYLPNVWAGAAIFGDLSIGASDIVNEQGIELPVWLFASEMNDNEEAIVTLLKGYNGCTDEVYSSADADRIYFPNQQVNDLLLNDQPASQVRVTVAADAAALSADRAAAVYNFFKKTTREVGYGPKAIRYTHDIADWGATVETLEVGGVTRSWIQYVPTKLKETAEGKVPLLVAVHGAALNGEYFAERTSYIKLAEEFGFIVVFPTGSVAAGIAPAWSTSPDDTDRNDVTFLKEMMEVLKAKLPIDTARMYVAGHSNGSGMAQRLIEVMPGTFAAACTTGMLNRGLYNAEAEQVPTPLWVSMGEFDMGNTSITADGTKTWIELYTGINKTVGEPVAYRAGRFEYYTWANEAGVPMLRYCVVDDMPHTSTLDLGYQYVTWMMQFSRGEDGSVVYGGGVYNAH